MATDVLTDLESLSPLQWLQQYLGECDHCTVLLHFCKCFSSESIQTELHTGGIPEGTQKLRQNKMNVITKQYEEMVRRGEVIEGYTRQDEVSR